MLKRRKLSWSRCPPKFETKTTKIPHTEDDIRADQVVFFLSAQEHKYLINRILPLVREVGVTPELRGWSWWKEPLKPYYSEPISMFSVCGKFCPTGRDVYLMYVERKTGRKTQEITLGASAHNLLEHVFGKTRTGNFDLSFEEWWKGELEHRGQMENPEIIRSCLAPL
ncbi:MAG: CRISPR-associated protein Cas4, partial [Candidatus Methanomethyliaceae archaeon]